MIFIAHSFENRLLVQRLEQRLREAHLTPWVAPGAVVAGQHWMTEVVKGIDASQAFVCLITQEANHSPHVQKELALAQDRKKRVIPILIGSFRLSDAFEYMLAGVQRVRVPRRGKGSGAEAIGNHILKVVQDPHVSHTEESGRCVGLKTSRPLRNLSTTPPPVFGVNYMRLFGAVEVPFLMDLIGATFEFRRAFGPYFGLEPPLGVTVAEHELVRFWKKKWPYKKARPLLNPLWRDIAGQKEEGQRLYWRALNGTAVDIAGYASHPTIDEDGEQWQRAARAQGLQVSYETLQRKRFTRSEEVGFLFGIFECLGKKRLLNVTLSLDQWHNPLARDPRFLTPQPFRKQRQRLRPESIALRDDGREPQGDSSRLELHLAEVRPKESFIALLQVYRSKPDGMPFFHLTDAHLPRHWQWIDDEGQGRAEAIRAPAGPAAARICVPSGWFGQ